jgi:hypothetical protein
MTSIPESGKEARAEELSSKGRDPSTVATSVMTMSKVQRLNRLHQLECPITGTSKDRETSYKILLCFLRVKNVLSKERT